MSKKTRTELLAAFIKANKNRREVIANRAGFDTPDEYKAHLEAGIAKEPETTTNENVVIHNVHLLDTSASMGRFDKKSSKCYKAWDGIKKELTALSKESSNFSNYLVAFESEVHDVYWAQGFKTALSTIHIPNWGNTALNDAIIYTIDKLFLNYNEEDRYVIKIFTDGGENYSEGSYEQARERIQRAEAAGMTVTFVGVTGDVQRAIRLYQVDESNTLVHDNTTAGVQAAFGVTLNSMAAYSSQVRAGATKEQTLKGFYKQTGKL